MDEDELKEAHSRLQQAIREDIPITTTQSVSFLAHVFCLRLEGNIEPLLNNEQLELYEQIITTLGEVLNNNGEDARGSILQQNFVNSGNILCAVFQFCQDAGQKCTGITSRDNIAQKLPTIFKLAYQIVKLLTDIDRLGEAFQDVHFLSLVFHTLIRCSEVLSTMDTMACIGVWKTLKKLYLSNRQLIGQYPTKFNSLFQVCTVTMSTMDELFAGLRNKDEKFIGKYEKICRFFLSIVLLVVEDFRNVMNVESGQRVFKVIHQILKFSSETRRQFEVKDCSSEYEMLHNNLLCVNEPLIKSFLLAECAVHCVMDGCRVTPDDNDAVSSAKVKLVVIVLEYLTEHPELHAKWFVHSDHIPHPRQEQQKQQKQQQQQKRQKQQPASVLELVFTMVDQCSSCFFKRHTNPMVVDSTKSMKEVSLYQTLLGRLCALVVTRDANHFQLLEQVLLSQLLHGTSSYSVLLASDLWCFVARSGKPELCLGHFVFLGKLLMELNIGNGGGGGCVRNVSCLLQRLFWFLEEGQHVEIVNTFPVHVKSVVLWKCLPVTHMKRVDTMKISAQIVDTFLSTTEQVKETSQQQRCIIENVQCLTSLLNSDPSVYPQLEQVRRHAVVDCIVNFWRRFTVAEESVDVDVELITSMLALTSSVIVHLQGKLVSQVLHTVSDILHNSDEQTFQLACTQLLSSLRGVTFARDHEADCLQVLAKMFQFLIARPDWLVEHSAMRALQLFAQETTYSRSLVTFLPTEKKKDFTRFLKKEAPPVELSEEQVLENVWTYLSKHSLGSLDRSRSAVLEKMENGAKELGRLMLDHKSPVEISKRIGGVISLLQGMVSDEN